MTGDVRSACLLCERSCTKVVAATRQSVTTNSASIVPGSLESTTHRAGTCLGLITMAEELNWNLCCFGQNASAEFLKWFLSSMKSSCCHQSYLCCFASSLQAPPPSVHSGISVLVAQEAMSRQQKQGSRVEGAPPTYSEVIGHYYHPTSLTPNHNHRTVSSSQPPPSSFIHGLLRPPPQQQGSVDNRNARNTKEKSQKPQQVWRYCFLIPSLRETQDYVCSPLGKWSVENEEQPGHW